MPPVDFFIVNVSLPSIQTSLGATPAELQLVVSGYASAYAVFLITGGRLGDLYGRRRLFLFGMAGFTAANLLCGVAASPATLVAGRIVQGIAAAITVPQVLGPVRTLFPTERELARALSSYGIMMGLAAVCGQFLGGALVEWSPFGLGWRAVFLLKVPVALAVLLAAWAVVPETSTSQRVRIDGVGAALLSLALACLVLPLSEGRQQGWPAWTFVMLAAVLPLIAVFLRFEARLTARGAMPLLDLRLMAIRSFRRGVVVGTLFFFTTAFYLTFSLYQQQGLGTDPLHTGLAILPYGAGLFVGPLASGPLVARLRHALLPIGMGIQVAGYGATGLAIFSGLTAGRCSWPCWWPASARASPCRGCTTRRSKTCRRHQAGVAAAVINSALQIGGAVSVAAIGSLFFTVLGGRTGHAAYANAFGIAQAATTLALFASMLLSISSRGRRPAACHTRTTMSASLRPRSRPRLRACQMGACGPGLRRILRHRHWPVRRGAAGCRRGARWDARAGRGLRLRRRRGRGRRARRHRHRRRFLRGNARWSRKRRIPAVTFLQGDAEALPCADAAFDAVVANFGVHHVPRPPLALAEAFRVLGSGRTHRRQLLGGPGTEHRMEAAVGRGAPAWRRCRVRRAAAGGRLRLGAADPGCAARRRVWLAPGADRAPGLAASRCGEPGGGAAGRHRADGRADRRAIGQRVARHRRRHRRERRCLARGPGWRCRSLR